MRVKLGKKKYKRHFEKTIGIWKIAKDCENPNIDQLEEMAQPLRIKLDRICCRYRAKSQSDVLVYRPAFGSSPPTIAIKSILIKDITK